jgi:hypothetical protein
MATWDDVKRLALALPDVEEGTTWGKPAFKIKGRSFVNPAREEGAIYLPCPDDEAQLLIRAKPEVYFLTPHYEGWGVLLRLDAADADELAGALEDSYAFQRDKKPLRPRGAGGTRRGSR